MGRPKHGPIDRPRKLTPIRLLTLGTLLLLITVAVFADGSGTRYAEVGLDRSELQETSGPEKSIGIRGVERGETTVALLSPPLAVPIASAEPFLAVTATWETSTTDIRVEMRGSSDGAHWTEWEEIVPDADSSTAREWVGSLLFLPEDTESVQYRVSLPDGAKLDRLRAVFISPGRTDPGLVKRTPPSPIPLEVSKPPIVSRTQWGCPDGQASPGWTPQKTDVTHLIVHHTVNSNNLTDWPAVVRSIFALHTYTNRWGDIGYNFLVDPNGVIYEGRAGGDDIKGAHFSCANSNTMGMAFLGTFTTVSPTDEAWDVAVQLLAWKAEQRGIDPLGVSYHPSTQLQLQSVSGHRDANPTTAPGACPKGTECPGDALYPMLPVLRTDIAALIEASSHSIEVTSPNGGEIWSVGTPHAITWNSSGLDPSGELEILLSLDGGETTESIAIVAPDITSVPWTPASGQITASARIWVGCIVDGATEAEDWSDLDFAIVPDARRRAIRRP